MLILFFEFCSELWHIRDAPDVVFNVCFQEKSIFSGMFKKTNKPAEGTTTDEVQ